MQNTLLSIITIAIVTYLLLLVKRLTSNTELIAQFMLKLYRSTGPVPPESPEGTTGTIEAAGPGPETSPGSSAPETDQTGPDQAPAPTEKPKRKVSKKQLESLAKGRETRKKNIQNKTQPNNQNEIGDSHES